MRPKALILTAALALAALVALPGTAAAKSAPGEGGGLVNSLAAGACAGEKQQIGRRAFRKRYGRHAAKACAKRNRGKARNAVSGATSECQAELDDYGEDEGDGGLGFVLPGLPGLPAAPKL